MDQPGMNSSEQYLQTGSPPVTSRFSRKPPVNRAKPYVSHSVRKESPSIYFTLGTPAGQAGVNSFWCCAPSLYPQGAGSTNPFQTRFHLKNASASQEVRLLTSLPIKLGGPALQCDGNALRGSKWALSANSR